MASNRGAVIRLPFVSAIQSIHLYTEVYRSFNFVTVLPHTRFSLGFFLLYSSLAFRFCAGPVFVFWSCFLFIFCRTRCCTETIKSFISSPGSPNYNLECSASSEWVSVARSVARAWIPSNEGAIEPGNKVNSILGTQRWWDNMFKDNAEKRRKESLPSGSRANYPPLAHACRTND